MTYVVAGVTGNTGGAAAETLLAGGQKVRVIVRDPAKGDGWKDRGAEVAVADLRDGRALAAALVGAQGAYLLVPPNNTAEDFAAYQHEVIDTLVAATRSTHVPHVVLLSSIGAHLPSGTGPIVALHRAEAELGAIPGTALTSIRAGYFMENLGGNFGMLPQGLVGSFVPQDLPIEMIASADVGRTAAAALREGPAHAGILELGGPARTMRDVAAVMSTVVGRPLTVAEAPVSVMAATLTGYGLSASLAGRYAEMTEAMIAGRVSFEGGHRRVLGSTSLEEFLPSFFARMSAGGR